MRRGLQDGPDFGGPGSQSNPASFFGLGVGSRRGIWSTVMVLQRETWGWGCSTHKGHPDPPGPCPTAPPGTASTEEIPIITAVAGGQLLLECPEGAEPHPNVEWHREGSLLQVPVTGPRTVLAGTGMHRHQHRGAGAGGDAGWLLMEVPGFLGGCPQAGPGPGAFPAASGGGCGGRRRVQLQGHRGHRRHQPASPGAGAR